MPNFTKTSHFYFHENMKNFIATFFCENFHFDGKAAFGSKKDVNVSKQMFADKLISITE